TTWHERAAQVRSQGLEALADAALSRWFTPAFQNRPAAAGARNMLTRTSREGYAGCCEALASADLHAHARSIAVPARVLVGEHDPATPPALAQELTGALPAAELHVIPQAAHLSCVEQPQAIAVQIRASLQHSRAGARAPGPAPGPAKRGNSRDYMSILLLALRIPSVRLLRAGVQ